MTKKNRAPRPLPAYSPGVITFREKHVNRTFPVPTEAHLHAVALMLVTERADPEYGWYYDPSEERHKADREEWGPKKPDLSLEAAEALPAGEIRDAALKQHEEWNRREREDKETQDFWDAVQRAIADKDGALAWVCLQQHEGHEYEGYELDGLEEIELLPRPDSPRHGRVWVDPNTGARWVYDKEINDWIGHLYYDIRMDRQAHRGEEVTRPER